MVNVDEVEIDEVGTMGNKTILAGGVSILADDTSSRMDPETSRRLFVWSLHVSDWSPRVSRSNLREQPSSICLYTRQTIARMPVLSLTYLRRVSFLEKRRPQ